MTISLRIAQVCPYDLARYGGVRSHIQGLGEALVARGHQVTVIAPGRSGALVETLGSLPVQQCGTVRPVDFSGTRIDLAWASREDRRRVLATGFDVLHLHTPWNPAIPLQLALPFRGVRVATFHDVPGEATPWWARRLMPLGAAIIRRLLLHATIGVSPAVSAYLGAGTHALIPNGIGEPLYDATTATQTTADPLGDSTVGPTPGVAPGVAPVVYLGRLEARKDVGTLLDAMARVTAVLGDRTPPLVIAGDGPLRGALEAQAHRLGVTRVTFRGAVRECDKWALLADAQCVVAPSRAGESFGIVLLEAMRAGSVPIAADNPGYRHVLSDGGESLLFPAGDAAALADQLIRAYRDAAWHDAMRSWGATRWPRFAWTRVAEEVERVYRDALAAA